MLEIIKTGTKFCIPRNSIVKIDTTYDSVLITLCDNTEVRYFLSVSPQVKAIMQIIKSTTSDIVVLDLDAAMSGRYDSVVTLKMKQQPQMVHINQVVQQPTTTTTTENKTVEKKKGGRPKGSKNKVKNA